MDQPVPEIRRSAEAILTTSNGAGLPSNQVSSENSQGRRPSTKRRRNTRRTARRTDSRKVSTRQQATQSDSEAQEFDRIVDASANLVKAVAPSVRRLIKDM